MLAAAFKAEAASFLAQFGVERLPDGRQRVVWHGAGPERTIRTGIGSIPVQRQKVRDRATDVVAEQKIRFTSGIGTDDLALPMSPNTSHRRSADPDRNTSAILDRDRRASPRIPAFARIHLEMRRVIR